MTIIFGAQGVSPTLRGQPTNVYSLQAGETFIIPAGTWSVACGPYSRIQRYDPITGIWRGMGAESVGSKYINSDGVNARVANQTGCVVGAVVTTAGSGYTSDPIATASGGNAVFNPVIGGAVNTSVTVTNGGTGYAYPPHVEFDAPPAGNGVQATGSCTISGGVVTAVTVVNQGAGYTNVPNITFINDARDTVGSGAAATALLTGAGTLTALLVTDHGTAVTSLPTISFSGGGGSSAAATAIMCWTTTAYTVTSAGSGYAGNVSVTGIGGFPTTTPAYTNPAIQSNLVRGRAASYLASIASGGVSATSQSLYDGGIYAGIPTGIVTGFASGSAAQVSFAVGGATDTFVMAAV